MSEGWLNRGGRLRTRRWLAAVVVVAVMSPTAAAADRREEERNEWVRLQAQLAQELDELAASDAELALALETLDAWIYLQVAELDRTQVLLAEATIAAERAAVAEADKAAEVENLEGQMATMAVNAYVQPPDADNLTTLANTAAPGDAARLSVYLDVQAERDTDIVQRLRRAREDLGRLTDRARDSEEMARSARDEASEKLSELDAARERFAEIHEEVLTRQEQASYESALVSLALVRSSDQVVADASAMRISGLPLVTVRGIQVHRSIAGQLEMMLDAAEADGIRLGGGGFRTNAQQIELRRAHCGDDPYSIFEMPAGECSPPTARPGNSMHELGLAVDLTYNGVTISSRNSPAFRWLAENAHIYGFHNLPSEPWHWSLNGS